MYSRPLDLTLSTGQIIIVRRQGTSVMLHQSQASVLGVKSLPMNGFLGLRGGPWRYLLSWNSSTTISFEFILCVHTFIKCICGSRTPYKLAFFPQPLLTSYILSPPKKRCLGQNRPGTLWYQESSSRVLRLGLLSTNLQRYLGLSPS